MPDINLDLAVLEKLTQAPGLPGREAPVADVIAAALPPDWNLQRDPLGNLVARRGEGQAAGAGSLGRSGPRVLLVAHMDEVGLVVRRITPQGFLRVERLGGMGVRAMPGSHLTLWTERGSRTAQVGLPPAHLDKGGPLELEQIFIDIGARSKAEAEGWGVQVGDGLTWHGPFERFGESCVRSKALDDRLGCFALLELARVLEKTACDLCLGFVVQEETMLQGGLPVAQALQPELVIGVDGTLAFDTPDLEGAQSDIRLGGGPALKLMDAIRGKSAAFVPDWELTQSIRRSAARAGIPLQAEVVTGISTAVTPLPYALGGLRTAALSLPVRYHHSAIETADLGDVGQLVRLLQAIVGDSF